MISGYWLMREDGKVIARVDQVEPLSGELVRADDLLRHDLVQLGADWVVAQTVDYPQTNGEGQALVVRITFNGGEAVVPCHFKVYRSGF